ncbi:MAG: ATP-binding protein [Candidatus Cloacimonetes bacterium]|nr:ATP-binding protein [Candidatus Cloacimonadota bacterium]
MIKRTIEHSIRQRLFEGKAIVVIGPRQSGKTTLLKKIYREYQDQADFYNCDETEISRLLSNQNAAVLKSVIGSSRMIFLDEAQRVDNIGLTIKIIVDTFPEVQVLASGSSAFELSDKLNEPLTGRKWEYQLYPLSFEELATHTNLPTEIANLKLRLLYGSYPEVVTKPGQEIENLSNLGSDYLYKDIFTLHDIRKPELIEKLLQALALQISSEVSYNELAQLLSSDPETIARYIRILERAFIIFRLPNFSTNQRNEIKRSRKIYFWDNGIRNSLLSDFRPIDLRDDIGKLWENYVVSELAKRRDNHKLLGQAHFWRSRTAAEVDYLEIENAQITAYEIKWNPKKKQVSRAFRNAYPEAIFDFINPENYFLYLMPR